MIFIFEEQRKDKEGERVRKLGAQRERGYKDMIFIFKGERQVRECVKVSVIKEIYG